MSCPHAIADLTPRPLLRLRAHPLRIALVGNPNVGKSVIFGRLTGRYVTVSNYPGTTVAVTRGRAHGRRRGLRHHRHAGRQRARRAAQRGREGHARPACSRGGAELVVQVADARNLRRALMLTSQLADVQAADDPRPQHDRRGARPRRRRRRRGAVRAARHSASSRRSRRKDAGWPSCATRWPRRRRGARRAATRASRTCSGPTTRRGGSAPSAACRSAGSRNGSAAPSASR